MDLKLPSDELWNNQPYFQKQSTSRYNINILQSNSSPCTGRELWRITSKQDGKIRALKMAFLRGVKRCSKLDRIRNEAIREELQVFKLNEKLKD